MKPRKWTVDQLKTAVKTCGSIRQVLNALGLREAGGNYTQVKRYIKLHNIDISHFHGRAWSKGLKKPFNPRIPLDKILVKNSSYQTYKLKKRLIRAKLKPVNCEECGWAGVSKDGRIPLELDHINGDSSDHRLENLRILCPNCHSLKPTHRGLNRSMQK